MRHTTDKLSECFHWRLVKYSLIFGDILHRRFDQWHFHWFILKEQSFTFIKTHLCEIVDLSTQKNNKNLRRRAVRNDRIEDAAMEIAATCGSSGAPTGCRQSQRYPAHCVAAEACRTRGCCPQAFSPPSLLQHIYNRRFSMEWDEWRGNMSCLFLAISWTMSI